MWGVISKNTIMIDHCCFSTCIMSWLQISCVAVWSQKHNGKDSQFSDPSRLNGKVLNTKKNPFSCRWMQCPDSKSNIVWFSMVGDRYWRLGVSSKNSPASLIRKGGSRLWSMEAINNMFQIQSTLLHSQFWPVPSQEDLERKSEAEQCPLLPWNGVRWGKQAPELGPVSL